MERSAEVDGDEGRSHAPSHGAGYPLGLAAAVAAGFFGGEVPSTLPSHVRYSLPWLHCGYCRVQRQSNRCCAGLVLAPMNFAEEDAKGLQYIPSMALGECLGPHFPHSSEVTSAV